MAFIEPSSVLKRPSGNGGKQSGGKRRISKEKTMAKRRRSPAQIAATKRMLAANAARKSNPTKKSKKRRRTAAKPVDVQHLKTGATQVRVKPRRPMSVRAAQFVRSVKRTMPRGKGRSTVYRVSPKGKRSVIIRENPANQTKAIVSAAVGFGTGLLAADLLDRFVATRKGDAAAAPTGAAALAKIQAPADGTRVFAQAAATGVAAIGAYALRKKSTVATYALGGMATAFAAKGLMMVITDMIMPKILPAKGKDGTQGRLAYGSLSGPRGYLRPFQGKPTIIGPQATGSVGGYGCTRTPVDPGRYSGGRGQCRPFEQSPEKDCIETVNFRPPSVRPVTPSIPSFPNVTPQFPTMPNVSVKYPDRPEGVIVNDPNFESPHMDVSEIVRQIPAVEKKPNRVYQVYMPTASNSSVVRGPRRYPGR